MSSEEKLQRIIEAVVRIDPGILDDKIADALLAGVEPLKVVNEGITVGLRRVGDLFAEEELFLPELVLAGSIVTKAVEKLMSSFSGEKTISNKGTLLIATVKGDVHDIGKNLVTLIMTASGYEVIDLGTDVSAEVIVDKVTTLNPQMIGLSSLLSTTMPVQREVIQSLEEAGVRDQVSVLVGGAPVTKSWAEEIGADGYAENASQAVREADRLMAQT
jgi:corrinoid protein of di/trimethylamine methyltransferase